MNMIYTHPRTVVIKEERIEKQTWIKRNNVHQIIANDEKLELKISQINPKIASREVF